jgi:hypothetical protein
MDWVIDTLSSNTTKISSNNSSAAVIKPTRCDLDRIFIFTRWPSIGSSCLGGLQACQPIFDGFARLLRRMPSYFEKQVMSTCWGRKTGRQNCATTIVQFANSSLYLGRNEVLCGTRKRNIVVRESHGCADGCSIKVINHSRRILLTTNHNLLQLLPMTWWCHQGRESAVRSACSVQVLAQCTA